nr:hypothetical protein [Methylobacterium sp. ZNC0032]
MSERRLSDLKASVRNARTHSHKQIHLIAESIREFRFTTPILVTTDGEIVAGRSLSGGEAARHGDGPGDLC